MKNKLEICKKTRKITADSLYCALKILLAKDEPIYEIDLRDTWLYELRKNKNLFPDGWYIPPPHGIAVLFATEKNPERLDFKGLRKEKNFPRKDVFLNRNNGLVFLYAEPINKNGIIGDIELTLYFGTNQEIKNYLYLHFSLIKKYLTI